MKTPTHYRRSPLPAIAFAWAIASTSLATAQTASAPPPSSQPPVAATPTDAEMTSDKVVKLDPFTVDATTGQSYGASNMASATRLNTPISDLPQTISVVNANLLQDEHSWTFDQAVRYVPGVTQRQNSPDGAIIHGLAASSLNHYEDGYFAPAMEADMADIDRIELIKGPSASVAGASESTGLINYITKKPQFTEANAASFTVGSWNFFRGVADSTGPIPGFDTMAYRVVATYTNSDTYRDNERVKKASVYPSFTWKIDPKTTLFVKADFVDNIYPGGYETPYLAPTYGSTATRIVVPANAQITLGRWAPINFNSSGFPGMQRQDTYNSIFAGLTHEFTDWLSVRQSVMYYSYTDDKFYSAIADNMYYDASGNLFDTFQVVHNTASQQSWRFQGDLALHKEFFSDLLSVKALAGYELARTRGTTLTFNSTNNVIPINILAPDYSQDVEANMYQAVNSKNEGGSFAYFGNAQIGVFHDMAILTAGVRRDQNKASWTLNEINGAVSNTPTTPVINSPMAGVTIKPLRWISLYAVYSDAGSAASTISTYPGIPTTDPRQILVAVTPDTVNKEFGAKFTFFHDNLAIDISHFQTTQNNISRNQTDPSFPGGSKNFIDAGNVTKGIEIDWAGDLTKQLSIFGGYVNDQTQAPGFKPYGGALELRGTPRDKVQMFLRYDLKKTAAGAIGVFGGVVHQTSVYGRAADTYKIPGATRADLGFDFHHNRWYLQAGVINVTNVIFPAFAVGQGSNTTDDPRNFYCTVGLKF
jgi:outer membrane receptor protein involved in Fe transport